ncbi:MAG: WXG100 family type VII secretion target [Actinomycetota bacterium]|nr:WXG100 family type VII secretion target [Actinomycetota bacterium]
MSRVLSTEEARASITQMQAIINGGLMEQIQSLDAQGQRLSDPNVWDGQLAAQFRGTWPETRRALENMRTQLEELRQQVEVINRNIMAAGGNA